MEEQKIILASYGMLAEIISIGLREMSGGLISDPISKIEMVDEVGKPMPLGQLKISYCMKRKVATEEPAPAPITDATAPDPSFVRPVRQKPKLSIVQGGKE